MYLRCRKRRPKNGFGWLGENMIFDENAFWLEEQVLFYKEFPQFKPKGKNSLNYWIEYVKEEKK